MNHSIQFVHQSAIFCMFCHINRCSVHALSVAAPILYGGCQAVSIRSSESSPNICYRCLKAHFFNIAFDDLY